MANRKQNNYSGKNFKKPGSKSYGKSTHSKKAKPNGKEVEVESKSAGDVNDASYYYGDANVLEQVMNFSFNEFGGVVSEIDVDYHQTKGKVYNTMIASYWLNPSIPPNWTGYVTEGINVAGLRNFLLLSGSNAKTTLYAPQDVTLLILALAEVIKVATFIARVFGVSYLFNYRNRTYPETLLLAMGIDTSTFADTLAANRVRFNKALAVASKIPFPADIPIFKKASELFGSIYLDDPSSALAQSYMFCPYSTWIFNEAYDANGAGLETLKLTDPANPVLLSAIIAKFENMVAALTTSTTLNTIYSDIMRLAQNGKLGAMITFSSIPENFMILPVYNEEIKAWIHNASIIGAPLATAQQYGSNSTNENDVSCDASNNTVKYMPQFKVPNACGTEMLIDFDHDQVTIDDKVKATRLTSRWSSSLNSSDNKYYTLFTVFGDEYVVEANFYTGTHNYSDLTIDNSWITPTTIANAIWEADVISKFDWAPLLYYLGTNNNVRIFGDLDYYTAINDTMLKKIYDYEILHFIQIG